MKNLLSEFSHSLPMLKITKFSILSLIICIDFDEHVFFWPYYFDGYSPQMGHFLIIFHGNGVQGHVGHMAIFMIVYNAVLLLSILRFARDLDKVDIALMGYTTCILFKLLFMHLKESGKVQNDFQN